MAPATNETGRRGSSEPPCTRRWLVPVRIVAPLTTGRAQRGSPEQVPPSPTGAGATTDKCKSGSTLGETLAEKHVGGFDEIDFDEARAPVHVTGSDEDITLHLGNEDSVL